MTLPWHIGFVEQTPPAPATLLVGEAGAGRDELALALAASFAGGDENSVVAVLKKVENKKEWFPDKNADILVVHPDAAAAAPIIPVDAARSVVDFCSVSPTSMTRRAVLLTSAECLVRTPSAVSALLKTLEEPAEDKSLILSARSASLLPPTIASRCRIIAAPRPDEQQAKAWLEQNGGDIAALAFCGGLPLDAAQTNAAQINAAAEWFAAGGTLNIYGAAQKLAEFDGWLDCLQKWTADGARAACGLPARYFPGRETTLAALGAKPRRWLDGHALLLQKRRLAAHPLARDLFMKEILHDYRNIFAD